MPYNPFKDDIRSLGIEKELSYKTSRSGGKGGQHVNKVETKVELQWDLEASPFFDEDQKIILRSKLQNRLNKEGILLLQCQSARTQLGNKSIAVSRFYDLLEAALKPVKIRKAKKMSQAAKEKRLRTKRHHSLKKQLRRKGDWE